MKKSLTYWILGISCSSFAGNLWTIPNQNSTAINSQTLNMSIVSPSIFNDVSLQKMLDREAPSMNADVKAKVITSMSCVNHHSPILSVIDYSRASDQKRLWIFDLNRQRLLYFTYVSHGLKSGGKYTTFFSNMMNSRASSLGVYLTSQAYQGREGSSLKLKGLDRGLNDNAENRSIVMHGGFYVEEEFIKKYGRAGRSWGCPALPHSLASAIINTIKEDNLLIVYYPSDKWFSQSRFLNCQNYTLLPKNHIRVSNVDIPKGYEEAREDVLFASIPAKTYGGETAPILAIKAMTYQQIFKKPAPLNRMLRRQINKEEYIAISKTEFAHLAEHNQPQELSALEFIVPSLKNNRGYVQTVMKPVPLGKIAKLRAGTTFVVETIRDKAIALQSNHQFIRWLGL